MADVINLRQARKQRDRAKAALLAETNRARFGRTKAERLAQQSETARKDKVMEHARLDPKDSITTDTDEPRID